MSGEKMVRSNRPNILFAIADDQSWPHAGAYGCRPVNTPAFDRIAEEGVLFTNAFTAAPQCSPNRAAILTGRNIWQLEEAGTHASNFPKKFTVYTELLQESGYELGYTGKGWGPGNWQYNGREMNPAGPAFDAKKGTTDKRGYLSISNIDYAENLRQFLTRRDSAKPFHFWYGSKEPHRRYAQGSGRRAGKRIDDVQVPYFLPDTEEIRNDILDYMLEIDYFDQHLQKMLQILEDYGELENTIIVVTSDNGMPFPRAKANLYEYGTHVPLAIRWPQKITGGRTIDDLTAAIDLAPTFLDAAGIKIPTEMTGRSIWHALSGTKNGRVDAARDVLLAGRERHTHARPDNLGYPIRAIRDYRFLYIHNIKPDRWPAGNPTGSGEAEGFHDVDASPTKSLILENKNKTDIKPFYELAFAKRSEEELYDIVKDPYCIHNLALDKAFADIKAAFKEKLMTALRQQNDPRAFGYEIFESYPRYSRMRDFAGFKERGKYNLNF
ncbi:sulfatase-like hydrolase/transferase [candidate division KSB1 bacterium]|nr:sulfatase-like hydrolase/transferase [candidate division KSB1 bacterium]